VFITDYNDQSFSKSVTCVVQEATNAQGSGESGLPRTRRSRNRLLIDLISAFL